MLLEMLSEMETNKKMIKLQVLLTESDWAFLEEQCAETNMHRSSYMRMLLRREKIVKKTREQQAQTQIQESDHG